MKSLSQNEQNFLTILGQSFDREGLEFLVLRGHEFLPKYIKNDIDFLVSDLEKATKICKKISLDFGFDFKIVDSRFRYVGCLVNGHIQLDFFSDLVKRWIPYINYKDVIKHRYIENEYLPKIDNVHFIAMVAAKELLTYGYIRSIKLDAIRELIKTENILMHKIESVLSICFTKKSVSKIVHSIQSKEIYQSKIKLRRNFKQSFRPFDMIRWIIGRLFKISS